jgi:NADH-quinone oxidoreductase subunit G
LVGESRPGWKVLRVLANLLNVHGIEFVSSEEVREALRTVAGARSAPFAGGSLLSAGAVDRIAAAGAPASGNWVDIPPYRGDTLVRGSESLAKTKDGHLARAVI